MVMLSSYIPMFVHGYGYSHLTKVCSHHALSTECHIHKQICGIEIQGYQQNSKKQWEGPLSGSKRERNMALYHCKHINNNKCSYKLENIDYGCMHQESFRSVQNPIRWVNTTARWNYSLKSVTCFKCNGSSISLMLRVKRQYNKWRPLALPLFVFVSPWGKVGGWTAKCFRVTQTGKQRLRYWPWDNVLLWMDFSYPVDLHILLRL